MSYDIDLTPLHDLRIRHIVKVYFSKRKPEITQEWLSRRYQFFHDFTLQSLRQQTKQCFHLWFCGDKTMDAEAFQPLMELMKPYPFDIWYSFGEDNVPYPGPVAENIEYVYVTRIDSDDLYAPQALELIERYPPLEMGRTEAQIFRRGYIHDMSTQRTGAYLNQSSPFHTLLFPRDTFTDPTKYKKAFVGDHSKIRAAYPVRYLNDWMFTVLIHGQNFLSTFDYAREAGALIPQGWTIDRFLNPPVVFDLDDFCDEWNPLGDLIRIKQHYSDFKCTLFTIPGRTSTELLNQARYMGWIELALHGVNHEPMDEMVKAPKKDTIAYYNRVLQACPQYVKGFRPPGWHHSRELIQACNETGLWMAMHLRDRDLAQKECVNGYYVCDERWESWHGHTHDVCGNWVKACLPEILTKWPKHQRFAFVSEAVLKRS